MKRKKHLGHGVKQPGIFPSKKRWQNSGTFPHGHRSKKLGFLSPFRSETQASFKVSRPLNRWYDHGAGKEGNVIDLVCLLNRSTVREALGWLDNGQISFSFHQQHINEIRLDDFKNNSESNSAINIIKIPARQRYYRIKKNNQKPNITQGKLDLLSPLDKNNKLRDENDLLTLNSLNFSEKIPGLFEKHVSIALYLDNDKAGKRAVEILLEQSPKCSDMSNLYKDYKDVNAWWMSKKL